jgi:uncharacterized protein YlzI (FlbEa/FlbD family)
MESINQKVEALYESFPARFKFFRQFISLIHAIIGVFNGKIVVMQTDVENVYKYLGEVQQEVQSLKEYIESLPAPRKELPSQPMTAANVMDKLHKAITQPTE